MGEEDGRIIYRVVIDDDGVERDASAAGQRAGGALGNGATKGAKIAQQAMIGAARMIGEAFVKMAAEAVQGIEKIVQAGVDFNARMEKYQTAFTTLLGTAEEAAAVMDQIRKDAASTPFDVDSLTQANQALISAGVSAGEARKNVLDLANAIAATGGGSAELSRMAANLQQIRNVGKATAMDIRQFANAGINIYGLLADSMGVTAAQAAEMEVTYEQLAEALSHAAEAGGMYAGALEAQSKTFNGQISTLKDNLQQLSGILTQDLFNTLAGEALPQVMEWVNKLMDAAQKEGIAGVVKVAGEIFHELMNKFNEALPDITEMGFKIIQTLFNAALEVVKEAPKLIVNLVKSLAETIVIHIPDLIKMGADLLLAIGEGISNAIPALLNMIPDLCLQMIETFKETNWAQVGIEIVDAIWSGLINAWKSVGPYSMIFKEVEWAVDGVKKILGIASPSKEFQYIGKMCVEGAELGIEDQEAQLLRTVKTTFEGVPEAASVGIGNIGANVGASVASNISHNMVSNVTGGNTYNVTIDAQNVSDFVRVVDLFDSLQVRARMA